jgi:ABC-type transporter Mla subunit MlaD
MNVVRNEIRTGIFVVLSLGVLVGVLIYLGAPGVLTPEKEFGIYFDNAAGIRVGTPVMLAGRKVGQVTEIDSPVPSSRRPVDKDGKPLTDKEGKPLPIEAIVMVRVDKKALIYNQCKVELANYSLLSEPVIDFTDGEETSGLAADNTRFIGARPGGLVDAGVQILEKIDPAVKQLQTTLKSLENTSNNLTRITEDGADLPIAFAEIRMVAANLKQITGPEGSLPKALEAIEALAGEDGAIAKAVADFRKIIAPDSDLSKALANMEKFTKDLSGNKDVPATLKNFRNASDRLNKTVAELRSEFSGIANNLEQASDTVKRQPWRLIWPSTKKYPEDSAGRQTVKTAAKPTPTPRRRK